MDTENKICENLHEVGCIKDICTCNNGPKRKIETLEEAANRCFTEMIALNPKGSIKDFIRMAVNFGSDFQSKKMYNEEEIIELLQKYRLDLSSGKTPNLGDTTRQWFQQFKK